MPRRVIFFELNEVPWRIIDDHVYRVLARLPSGERRVMRRVARHFVTASGGKVAQSSVDLAEVSGLPARRIEPVLQCLIRQESRLLQPLPAPPGGPPIERYEVFHDILVRPVLGWWRDQETQARERRTAERNICGSTPASTWTYSAPLTLR